MRHLFILILIVIVGFTNTLFAELSFDLTDFEKSGLHLGSGYVNVGGNQYFKAALHPDFLIGPVELGVDVNLYAPVGELTGHPSDLTAITLRKLSYDHYGMAGVTWGHIQKLTLGYGLLMDHYDSGSFGSPEFNTSKAGFSGYGTYDLWRVDALWTASNVKAGRLSYTLPDTIFLGAPIVFGGTYVDDDGFSESINGSPSTQITRPGLSAYGFDIALPIAGSFLTLYSEYAKLVDQGKGVSTGFKGGFFDLFDFRFEYRALGKDFVPGYFNKTYETTSFNFASDAATRRSSGVLAAFASSFLDGYAKWGALLESYEGETPKFSASLGWQELLNTVGVVNYSQPFQGSRARTLTSDVLYRTGGLLDYLIHYKLIFLPSGGSTETYNLGFRIHLGDVITL